MMRWILGMVSEDFVREVVMMMWGRFLVVWFWIIVFCLGGGIWLCSFCMLKVLFVVWMCLVIFDILWMFGVKISMFVVVLLWISFVVVVVVMLVMWLRKF